MSMPAHCWSPETGNESPGEGCLNCGQDPARHPVGRWVLVRHNGAASGTVYHTTRSCTHMRGTLVDNVAPVGDTEVRLLGLYECRQCWKLTHDPEPEEQVLILREAIACLLTGELQDGISPAVREMLEEHWWRAFPRLPKTRKTEDKTVQKTNDKETER